MSGKGYIDQKLHDRLWFHHPFESTGCSLVSVLSYDGDENEDTAQGIVDYLEENQTELLNECSRFYDMDVDWNARSNETALTISHDMDGTRMAWTVGVCSYSEVDFRETERFEWSGALEGYDLHEAENLVTGTRCIEDTNSVPSEPVPTFGPMPRRFLPPRDYRFMPFYQCMLAHLQAHADDMRTPYEVADCVQAFCHLFEEEYYRAKQRQLRPNVRAMLTQAKQQAAKTSTGIDGLDSILCGGFQRGGIYVIAGDPSAGKTALAVQCSMFAANQCAEDECVCYFMLDQGGCNEVVKRGVSLAHAIMAGMGGGPCVGLELSHCDSWTNTECDKGVSEYDALSNRKLVVSDKCNIDVIMLELDRLYDAKLRPRMLVIDYYQLVQVEGVTVASDANAASEIMSRLREWSYEHRACVLLCGQYSKQSIERHQKGEPPRNTDLLGGVDVPYQAQSVLCITNEADGSGTITIADCKHRQAGNMAQADRAVTLTLDGEHGYIS